MTVRSLGLAGCPAAARGRTGHSLLACSCSLVAVRGWLAPAVRGWLASTLWLFGLHELLAIRAQN
jgi:hypothetical protein